MTPPVACVMCLLTPDAQQMVVPVAQATVLVAPFLLRDRLRTGWTAFRRKRRGHERPDEADASRPAK
jgi:hypothetical protein